ncbi:MAG: lipoyl synthase, partial [Candidatus Micrarchaeota archaeon]|nr:lipoyl synthase [Candidatus Micrarchaeota archaeon]
MLPEWLRIKPASTEKYSEIKQEISGLNLHTVCVEAHCPNITECWSGGTATFMVLG